MRIYQPLRGVGAAYKENSFVVFDDAGVEIGQGGLEFRVLRKMYEERPLDIEMIMDARVYLDLWVKVRKNWRDNEANLKQLGFSLEDQS